jgi:SNF2 family DNA or RNA helicase
MLDSTAMQSPALAPNLMAHISAKHRKLVVPHMDGIKSLIPEAVPLQWQGAPHLVLPHHEDHVKVVQNFGVQASAPILSYYDWCNGTPFEAQRQSAAMLTVERRAYVLNGMGTGKTRTVLWAFDWLRKQGMVKRMLVVAPLSTLHMTWAREVFATVPHLKANVVYGPREKRLALLADPADIYIINHDGMNIVANEVINRPDIDVVVLDELAVYRTYSTRRWKTMNRVLARKERVWGLTGSPTPNEPTDAWAQVKLVTPSTMPFGLTTFRESVMLKVTQFKWVPKPGALDKVREVMRPAVRYTLDDVVELPEVVIRTVDVPLGTRQAKVYDELEKRLRASFAAGDVTVMNAAILMNKLLQVSLGYVYTDERGIVALDNDQRMDALVDSIESTDRKVIVFVPFIHALDGVSAKLKAAKIDHAVVSGDTSKAKRDEIFGAFQGSLQPRVLVAHPQCMSHGLTLTAADTIIWFGPFASLEVFEQANARITRVGQKHRQQVLLFTGSVAESKLYKRLREKKGVQDTLLEMLREQTANHSY